MNRDDGEGIDGYSSSRDSDEYDEYQRRLKEITDEIGKLRYTKGKIEKYNAKRKKLIGMGVWEEVISMIHDYQVIFPSEDKDKPEYDTFQLVRCVSLHVASIEERRAMAERGVPETSFAYSIDWPEDPVGKLKGIFFIDSRRNEARNRLMSNYFKQRFGELEEEASADPPTPSRLEKTVEVAQPFRFIAGR